MSRVAVVTGGASGIGLGIVERFVADGYRVAAWDIQADPIERLAKDLGVLGQVVDVSDRAAVDAAIGRGPRRAGPDRGPRHRRGDRPDRHHPRGHPGELGADDRGEPHRHVQLRPVRAGDMVAAGWGRIVTISSSSAQSGAPDMTHYVASKGGVISLTKALAVDLRPLGITANTIPPSIVDTPMAQGGVDRGEIPPARRDQGLHPDPPGQHPRRHRRACAFLCSDEGSSITGQIIGVNGGMYM